MSGREYIYDVVWCELEMIENKQFFILYEGGGLLAGYTNCSSLRLLMPRGSRVLAL